MIYHFFVPGIPQGQGRPRASRIKTKAGFYTTVHSPRNQFAADVKLFAVEAGVQMIEGPVMVNCIFLFPRPQRLMKKSSSIYRIPHTGKPDLDNLLKLMMDTLNGVAWRDDSQIWKATPEKFYVALTGGDLPGADITICGGEKME